VNTDDEPETIPIARAEAAALRPETNVEFKVESDAAALADMISQAAESIFSRLDDSRDQTLRGLMLAADLHDMRGANLSHADLHGEDLSWIDFEGADLSGADLRNCNLANAVLRNANLTDARLDGANLEGATLEGALNVVTYPRLLRP